MYSNSRSSNYRFHRMAQDATAEPKRSPRQEGGKNEIENCYADSACRSFSLGGNSGVVNCQGTSSHGNPPLLAMGAQHTAPAKCRISCVFHRAAYETEEGKCQL